MVAARPNPDAARAACVETLAEAWSIPPAGIIAALGHGLRGDDQVTRWLRARLALAGHQPDGPVEFPRAVAFPLAAVDRRSGAVGLVACEPVDPTIAAGRRSHDATQQILAWFGAADRASLAATLHVPDGTDGGSLALAVLIAALLAAEPELLPGFGGPAPEIHRFAATGSLERRDGTLRLVTAGPDGMPPKLRALGDWGYRTLFTIAGEADLSAHPDRPPEFEIIPLPGELPACVDALRRHFVSRLPRGARLRRWYRRRRAALRTGLAATAAALAVFVSLEARDLRRRSEQAQLLLAAARGRAGDFDTAGELELLEQARSLRPDLVPGRDLAAARARAAAIAAAVPAPFGGLGQPFAVFPDLGIAVAASPDGSAAWHLGSGARAWSTPRPGDPVTAIAASGRDRALVATSSGRISWVAAASGQELAAAQLPCIAVDLASRADGSAVIASEDGLWVWTPGQDVPARLPIAAAIAPGDRLAVLPSGTGLAVVHATGGATLVERTGRASSVERSAPLAAADGTATLLAVGGGLAWHAHDEARRALGWDLSTGRATRALPTPEGWRFACAVADRDPGGLVAILVGPAGRAARLARWSPAASGPEPDHQRPLPPAAADADELCWAGDRKLLAHASPGYVALLNGEPRVWNGGPLSFGSLLRIDLDTGLDPGPGLTARPTAAAVAPDGRTFVLGAEDGSLVWGSLPDLAAQRALLLPDDAVVGCWWDADGLLLATASGRLGRAAAPDEPVRWVDELPFRPAHLDYDPSRRLLLAAPAQRLDLRPLSAAIAQPWVRTVEPEQPVADFRDRPLGRACLVDLGAAPPAVTELLHLPDNLLCAAIGSGGQLAFGGRDEVEVRSLGTTGRGMRARTGSAATAIAFAPDGRRLAVGDAAGAVHVFSASSLDRPLATLPPAVEGHPCSRLAWSADGLKIAAWQTTEALSSAAAARSLVQIRWATGTGIWIGTAAPDGVLVGFRGPDGDQWLRAGSTRQVDLLR